MHALHLSPRHLWKMGLLALGLTLVVLVAAAAIAPTIADLTAPSATTAETTAAQSSQTPAWVTDPMAPPSLLQAR